MNLQKMKDEKAAAVALMGSLVETAEKEARDLTDAEKAQFDEAEKKASDLSAAIKEAEERTAKLAAHRESLDKVTPAASRSAGPTPRAAGPEAPKEFESLTEFLAAATMRPNDPRLAALWRDPNPSAEQRMDTGGKGGFAVPTQFIPTLRQAEGQGAVVRPRATVIPAGDPPDAAVTMPALDQSTSNMRGGVEVGWIGEGATKPETDADFRQITLQPQEVAAYVTITDKLLRNWGAASSVIERLLREGVTAAEEVAFYRGNGVAKPLGLLNSGALIGVARTTANQVTFADIANMFSNFKLGGNSTFILNQSVLPKIINLTDGDGRLIWQANARDGIAGTLMGYPAVLSEFAPALGTKGDLVLANLSDYLIKDGSGPIVESDGGIVNFKSNKTIIKITWNVDGQPWLTAPLKGEDGRDYSPFIALDVPDES